MLRNEAYGATVVGIIDSKTIACATFTNYTN